MKTNLRLIAVLAILFGATVAHAGPASIPARSPVRYFTCIYNFSTTASITGTPACILPADGMVLKDVAVSQVSAGEGGTSWVATPKRGATALVSTAGGFTLAAGALKSTNTSVSPVRSMSLPTGGTRPVVKRAVAATQTIVVGSIAEDNNVVIGGITYTAKDSGAAGAHEFNILGSAALNAAALAALINADPLNPCVASVSSDTITLTAKRVGSAGNSITTTSTANFTPGAGTLANGFDYGSTAGDIVVVDVTLTGSYSSAVTGTVQLSFESTL